MTTSSLPCVLTSVARSTPFSDARWILQSEGGCTYQFDFSHVYWNSRLSTEHGRLVDSFSENDVVVDAFAGVGPFAIPAGKKGCGVLASDLNPASASALRENARINKVRSTHVLRSMGTDTDLLRII